MSAVTLNGVASSRGRVQIPAWGAWWADVDLSDDAVLSGAVTLLVGDAEFSGTIVSGGVSDGRAAYRVVGGAGGLGRTLPARGYHDADGVRVSTVVGDLASEAGESIVGASSARRGPHYARPAQAACVTLAELAPQSWYVASDGVVHVGARPEVAYAGDAPRVRVDSSGGVIDFAVDSDVPTFVPGLVVDGAASATDVELYWEGARLTARVWSGARPSRRLDAWRRVYDAIDPRRAYRGVTEYRVVTQTGELFALQAVRVASGMPDLQDVPCRGVPGVRATVTLGELVLVAFVDGDPSRPAIIAHDAPGAPGWSPSVLELGDTGGDYAALAAKVDANFEALFDLFSDWTPMLNDGGTALKTLWTAWLAGPPPRTQFDAVGSAKVKVSL